MNETNPPDDWRELCELASKERDPKKLLDLVTRINRALEDPRHQSQRDLNPRFAE